LQPSWNGSCWHRMGADFIGSVKLELVSVRLHKMHCGEIDSSEWELRR